MTNPRILQAQETAQTHSGKSGSAQYMNFRFFRLDNRFHTLMPNEKVVAKQELLSTFDVFQRQMALATYSLTGLRSDCDILIWRIHENIEAFQTMSCRILSSGMGKYLSPVHSFLGMASLLKKPSEPALKYLFVHPCSMEEGKRVLEHHQKIASKYPSVRIQAADCSGFDNQGFVLAFEAEDARDYLKLTEDFKSLKSTSPSRDYPVFTCVLKDVRDIVDCFG